MFAYVGAKREREEEEETLELLDDACGALEETEKLLEMPSSPSWRYGSCEECQGLECEAELHAHAQRLLLALNAGMHLFRASSNAQEVLQSVREALEARETKESDEELVWGAVGVHRRIGGVKRWQYVALGVAGVAVVSLVAFRHRLVIVDWGRNMVEAARLFVRERVVEPMHDVYRTVRYNERQFQVSSPLALAEERQSLGRMVADFEGLAVGSEVREETVAQVAASGDIARVMPAYEESIKHPLRGALGGHLVQLLLLQLQKAKADVAMSLSAVDSLLASNEINLQLLAAIPAVYATWWTGKWLWRVVQGKGVVLTDSHRKVRARLARIASVWAPGGSQLRRNPLRYARFVYECSRIFEMADSLPDTDAELVRETLVGLLGCDSSAGANLLVTSLLMQSDAFKL